MEKRQQPLEGRAVSMEMRGAKVVVTGGAGFVGSELVRQLIAGGAQVCVLDNLSNGKKANLQDLTKHGLEFVEGDVRDDAVLRRTLRNCRVLFHLACLGVRHSIGRPLENHAVNATGTLHVLEAAREAQVERMVHVSTSEVYGNAQSAPMAEDHPTRPTTAYGASKLAGEAYAQAFHHSFGLPVVVLRPFNSYGPRSHAAGSAGEVIPRFLQWLQRGEDLPVFGDGLQTRDFTFVGDTARGILQAGFQAAVEGFTFNLGSGREVSLLGLGGMLAEILGVNAPQFRHLPERPGDMRRLVADSSLAEKHLKWKPSVPLEDGLRATVEWFLAHPDHELMAPDEPAQNWQVFASAQNGS